MVLVFIGCDRQDKIRKEYQINLLLLLFEKEHFFCKNLLTNNQPAIIQSRYNLEIIFISAVPMN